MVQTVEIGAKPYQMLRNSVSSPIRAKKIQPKKIDRAPIENKSQIRDLGMIVSEDLKFHAQVYFACK